MASIGKKVPDFFELRCNEGVEHRLSNLRGSKVLLCFYWCSHCPVCASAINKFVGSYKKLAWASKLKVVTIFLTDVGNLSQGLSSNIMKMKHCTGVECYPFLALADRKGTAVDTFQVKVLSIAKAAIQYPPHRVIGIFIGNMQRILTTIAVSWVLFVGLFLIGKHWKKASHIVGVPCCPLNYW